MAKKIGIFGGSFNPIHNGHVALADYLQKNAGLDEVWIIVSPLNPLKEHVRVELASNEDRLRMVELALEGYEGLRASDIEFGMKQPNYTIDTLRKLDEENEGCEFSLIIGADNLEIFDRWKGHEEIMENYGILVYPRPGVDVKTLMDRYKKAVVVEGVKEYDVSSTEVRRRVRSGEDVGGLIDEKVKEYIESKGLYGRLQKAHRKNAVRDVQC